MVLEHMEHPVPKIMARRKRITSLSPHLWTLARLDISMNGDGDDESAGGSDCNDDGRDSVGKGKDSNRGFDPVNEIVVTTVTNPDGKR